MEYKSDWFSLITASVTKCTFVKLYALFRKKDKKQKTKQKKTKKTPNPPQKKKKSEQNTNIQTNSCNEVL